jgi:hypothetical protein
MKKFSLFLREKMIENNDNECSSSLRGNAVKTMLKDADGNEIPNSYVLHYNEGLLQDKFKNDRIIGYVKGFTNTKFNNSFFIPSIETQINSIEKYVKDNNKNLISIYVDDGFSLYYTDGSTYDIVERDNMYSYKKMTRIISTLRFSPWSLGIIMGSYKTLTVSNLGFECFIKYIKTSNLILLFADYSCINISCRSNDDESEAMLQLFLQNFNYLRKTAMTNLIDVDGIENIDDWNKISVPNNKEGLLLIKKLYDEGYTTDQIIKLIQKHLTEI